MKNTTILTLDECANECAELFYESLSNGTPIYSTSNKNKQLVIAEDEIFKQCYADTPTRNTFPVYWFTSKYHLLTFYNGKIKWIEGYDRARGTKFHKYKLKKEDGTSTTKNIEFHVLVALVFESEVYGRAKELLKEYGVYAFGVKSKNTIKANCHHEDNLLNNDPGKLQIISTPVHTLLDSIPNLEATEKKHMEFMKRFSKLVEKEEPNKISLITTGYSCDDKEQQYKRDAEIGIHAMNNIYISPHAFDGVAVYEVKKHE